jgi:general secretion pathway protein G
MNRTKQPVRRSREGFTLIEVLLVVVIIGILVGVAMPRLGGKVQKAQISRTKADVENIGLALRMYELENGRYPNSLQALISNAENSGTWDGPYLEKGIPNDPWGNPYSYQQPGSRNAHSYDLYSHGPDGTAGNEDDIGNWQ